MLPDFPEPDLTGTLYERAKETTNPQTTTPAIRAQLRRPALVVTVLHSRQASRQAIWP